MKKTLAILITMGLAAVAGAAVDSGDVKFEIKNDSSRFMMDVARMCLSTPESKIENLPSNEIKVSDKSPNCAQEIKAFAIQWDREPTTKTVAIHVKTEKMASVSSKIKGKYQDAIALQAGKSCPCILLKGNQAKEAAQFAWK